MHDAQSPYRKVELTRGDGVKGDKDEEARGLVALDPCQQV